MEKNPIKRFGEVYARARESGLRLPDAVSLATVGKDGQPSLRMVLLKGFDERGFVFYTNLKSRKGRELQDNPRAALCFWWEPLDEQVRIEGRVEPVTPEEADSYFARRDRGSQLGAWASQQSRSLGSRTELINAVDEVTRMFSDREVPRPGHWSGLRVKPDCIEFWIGQPHRLHQRDVYRRQGDSWHTEHLYP